MSTLNLAFKAVIKLIHLTRASMKHTHLVAMYTALPKKVRLVNGK